MTKGQNIIELNGKKYDAATGKMVAASSTTPTEPHKKTHKPLTSSPKFNEFVKVSRQPQRTKTLMRHIVKKPTVVKADPSRRAHAQTTPIATHPHVKASANTSIKPERVALATNVPKSSFISRFGANTQALKPGVIAVKPAPPAHHQSSSVNHKPVSVTRTQGTGSDMFDTAIADATSHEQPQIKRTPAFHKLARKLHVSPRTLMAGSTGLAALLVAGILVYTNVPNVAMKVAATRAGVSANLPGYQPAGFSLKGPISYAPGEISVMYKSNTDNRDFKVTQATSEWNSETLLDNFVTPDKKSYQTLQQNGRTIYIYDGSNATWVDGGIWFKIEGKSNLNSDQLLKIANSL